MDTTLTEQINMLKTDIRVLQENNRMMIKKIQKLNQENDELKTRLYYHEEN